MFSVCKDILYAHIPEIDHGQCHLDLYLPESDPGSAYDGREFEPKSTDGKFDTEDLQLKPMVTQGKVEWSEFQKCDEDERSLTDINEDPRKRESSGVPFVLFFHGGGWRRGGRAAWTHYLYFDVNFLVAFIQFVIGTYGNIGETLARNKIACAIVSYPLTEAGALTLLAEMVCSYILSTLFVFFVAMPIPVLIVLLQMVSNSDHNTWRLMFKPDHSAFTTGLILIMILTNLIKAVLFLTRRKQFNISSNLLSHYCFLGTISLLISYRTQSVLFLMVSTLALNEGVLFYLRRLRHGATYKQQVQAVVQAIKWAKRFSEEHRYTDPERLYLMGHSAGGHLATLSALDHSALTSVSCSPADLKILDETCGQSKGCYYDCPRTTECNFLVTWSYRPEVEAIAFSMSTVLKDMYNPQWFAIAFSADKLMGKDSVIECVTDTNLRQWADVRHSYNDDKYNVDVSHPKQYLREMSGMVHDGILTCNFTRLIDAESTERIFSLDEPWFLFVTSGYIKHSTKLQHKLYPEGPFISPNKVDFREHTVVQGLTVYSMVKIHGCLMIFSWMMLASASIVLARFYKHQWPSGRACGRRMWYQIHKILMLVVFTCVSASFVVIWVHTGGYAKLEGANFVQRAHPTLGVIVMGLTFINPLLAVFRPRSDSASRPVFKYVHGFVGTAVYVLAILNIILGVTLPDLGIPVYMLWVIIGFAGYQLMVEILLEAFECYLIKTGQKSDYEIREMSAIRNSVTKLPSPPGSIVKSIWFACHVGILLGFGIFSIIRIAV